MNSSQMMLTIAGMLLLSIVILRVNNSFLSTSEVLLNSKYNVIAISLASSIIEEAGSKAFDEITDSTGVTNPNQLTSIGNLGPDGELSRAMFNDFDDFNNFAVIDTFVVDSLILGVFKINCTVSYVEENAPETPVFYETWYKLLDVSVTSDMMTDTVRMSTIYGYWYFR